MPLFRVFYSWLIKNGGSLLRINTRILQKKVFLSKLSLYSIPTLALFAYTLGEKECLTAPSYPTPLLVESASGTHPAYCYSAGYLVVGGTLQTPATLDGQPLRTLFTFQNLTFLKVPGSNSRAVAVSASEGSANVGRVQVVIHRNKYARVHDAYHVGEYGGMPVFSGKGEVGGLVLSEGKAVGVVCQVGEGQDEGLFKVIEWGKLANVVQRNQHPAYLGVVGVDDEEGVQVTRVKGDSPIKTHLALGDLIVGIDGYRVQNMDDLKRLLSMSGKQVRITIKNNQNSKDITFKV